MSSRSELIGFNQSDDLSISMAPCAQFATISSLPTELLLIIFEHLYTEETQPSCLEALVLYPTCGLRLHLRTDKLSPSPALFPYALADVCTSWKDVVSAVPKFWTRLLISLDDSSSSFKDLSSHLVSSCNLPLEIHAETPARPEDPSREASLVSSIMKLLGPHIFRCLKLSIKCRYSSSLPSLTTGSLGRTVESLHCLKLECEEDGYQAMTKRNPVSTSQFSFRSLTTLSLSGTNVFEFCTAGSSWMAGRDMHSLSLSNYHANDSLSGGLSHADLFDILLYPSLIHRLKLSNIRLRISDAPTDAPHPLRVHTMQLEDLQPELTATLLNTVALPHTMQSLHITRCALHEVSLTAHCDLVLEDIPPDHSLIPFVGDWDGARLTFLRCPFVDDAFLEAMTDGGSSDEFMCPFLRELVVSNCGALSVPVLKELVRKRRDVAEAEMGGEEVYDAFGFGFVVVRPLFRLVVSGAGYGLGAEDRDWFERMVGDFRWDADSGASTELHTL
ncbi:hypothetical protein HYDPIDRAFT_28190 [Hydnomerulius pinastri MD-312]|uniref:F-box domain-containing protein n=1 Tax=Hydnomerulius pinastri MD-312 TaxID=994086 RepID=A0A0C9WG54_9AGAM|nr:hypothetical protein HYDPIDRAFT_28190 [Hydnomerulius pinastri MD-312]